MDEWLILLQSLAEDRTVGSIPVQGIVVGIIKVKHKNPIVCSINRSFAYRTFDDYDFYKV